jgi:hypothetical protein
MKGCGESRASTTIFVVEYVLILSFETSEGLFCEWRRIIFEQQKHTVIAALTFHQWLKHFRKSTSPLIKGLYRDGMMFYIFLCCKPFSATNVEI